ncbi:short-chain dehydrogenase/reductase [Streptomyces xanthochromogenes]|uniref:oxidoreductase n=1 Tax=Streptomyces TaxID=1883 RepID=UPI001420FDD0|nr:MULTISPECIES: oxidoreductase [Streptomyces]GHB43526.1 short-chain dehydrogenase/reductase [Streptomyces xanthochromogenes]
MSVWLITGSSRGLGLHIAREALAAGNQVVATARDAEVVRAALGKDGGELLCLPLDVTDEQQAREVAQAAVERFGRIDVLVNNAGRGLLGAVEEASDAEARAVFDINVFGLLAVTRAVLPHLRRERAGRIFNISSVGGFTAGSGWGIYNSTKFAVEGLSEALRADLAPLGIHVTIVEPGVFRTDFLDDSSLHSTTSIEDYAGTVGKTRQWALDNNHQQPGDPVKAARAIVTVAGADAPPMRLPLGADCVARVESKLETVAKEVEAWRELALDTAI